MTEVLHGRRWSVEADGFLRLHWSSLGECVSLAGCLQHVAAIEVRDDGPDAVQVARNSDFQPELDALQTMAEGRLATVELPGLVGRWVVFAQPFGD